MELLFKKSKLFLHITLALPLCFFFISASGQLCGDSVKISYTPVAICSGTTTTFTATAPPGATNPNFQWLLNGSSVGFNFSTYINNSLKSGDIVKCIFTGINCKGMAITTADSIIASVSPVSKPSISISTSASNICKGSNVIFIATSENSGAHPIYQWKVNGLNAGANNDTFSTTSLNNGDVVNCALTVDPAFPCAMPATTSSYGIAMNVSEAIPPVIAIVASANDVCPGTPITFTASVQNAGASLSYQWKLNDMNTGSDSPTYANGSLANNDEIYCMLTDSSGCARAPVSSEKILMSVKSLPEIIITPIDTFVSPGTQVRLNANVPANISSYNWQPSQSLSSTSSLSPLTQPLLANTNYFFNAITTDGCSVSKEITIKILGNLNMPNAFTPNEDGHNDLFRIPSNTNINLREFSIYNRLGNKVFSTANPGRGWDGNVNGKQQDAGVYVYVISVIGKNGKVVYKGSFLLIR